MIVSLDRGDDKILSLQSTELSPDGTKFYVADM